jgi:hypothetical protein
VFSLTPPATCSFLLAQVKGTTGEGLPAKKAQRKWRLTGGYSQIRCEQTSPPGAAVDTMRPPGETLGAFAFLKSSRRWPRLSVGLAKTVSSRYTGYVFEYAWTH